jgi:hypothetical protein
VSLHSAPSSVPDAPPLFHCQSSPAPCAPLPAPSVSSYCTVPSPRVSRCHYIVVCINTSQKVHYYNFQVLC